MFIRITAVSEILKKELEENWVYDSVQISNEKLNKAHVKWLENFKCKSWSMGAAPFLTFSEIGLDWLSLEKMETTPKRIKLVKWLDFSN